ncbi:MAG: tRNA (adenosine(37)-N6)-threonylcarbamoyltransferase complex ATPase subunit type 1 TsaE [Acidobacteriota bacterium]
MIGDFVSRSEEETERFGERLAATLSGDDVVYLSGALGAGKTCLARGVARGLGARARDVASPTFALLHEYAGEGGRIVLRHLDLYRLEDSSRELDVLGLPESVAGAPVLVEWPNRSLAAVLPATRRVTIEVFNEGERRIRVAAGP